MKQVAWFILVVLVVGCSKQKKHPNVVKEDNQVAKTIHPDTIAEKSNYPAITGLWENEEYFPNLIGYKSITKTDSLADFYTHLLYEGDSLLYGNKRNLIEEDYFFVLPNYEVLDYKHKPSFTITAFTDSTLEIVFKATDKVKKFKKVLPLTAIQGKAASILFLDQLNLLTNKWFASKYEVLFPDSTRSELTFKNDGTLLGYPKYNKYVVSSFKRKDVISLSGNSKELPVIICELVQGEKSIQLFELNPTEDIDDPLIRTGRNFILKKL